MSKSNIFKDLAALVLGCSTVVVIATGATFGMDGVAQGQSETSGLADSVVIEDDVVAALRPPARFEEQDARLPYSAQ